MTLALDGAPRLDPPAPARQAFRTAAGGLVDRAQALRFRFDGRAYDACAGDTLASALLANGVHLVGRSFKYHRPRGILSAGPEEPSALVELRTGARREPNTRATMVELFDGLEAASQNRWPSLRHDAMAVTGLLAPVFAAGFYYKTFMWPAAFWEKVYEPMIRRAAGLGRAAGAPDPDHYDRMHAHCDVLVIGGGPAGLAAALAAGRGGARTILLDEHATLGGRLLSERGAIGGIANQEFARRAARELASLPTVRVLTRTTAFGAYDHGQYGAVERVADHLATPPAFTPRQRSWRIVAKRAVLAAGAIERPLVFGGNDRPGVMLAGAVRSYVNRYGVLPGRSIALFTTGDEGWRTVTDVVAAGGRIAAVVDPRDGIDPSLLAMAEACGAPVLLGSRVAGTAGRHRIAAITTMDRSGASRTIACDCLAMSNGWNPTLHLASHRGHRPVWDDAVNAFVPGESRDGLVAVGAAAGLFALEAVLNGGSRAGAEAARSLGFAAAAAETFTALRAPDAQAPVWKADRMRGKAFVDFQNDVGVADVVLAHREGFRAVEHLKRYTTLGMATDQGKTANLAGLGIMAALTGRSIPETGTTVFRPPYTPVSIGALAGCHRGAAFRPTRRTPTHRWAEAHGAVFVPAGPWLRAAYFKRPAEADWLQSVAREVSTVRSAVGICDVSTFGKIDIQGPDAARLIDMVCANAVSSLSVGRARYAIVLREDGFVMDDGTVARLGETHYVMTASTANAARVMQHVDLVQQWLRPEYDAQVASVSEQWAQFAIAGPRARDVLRAVVDPGHDISNAAFPFLACAEISVGGGIPARLFRISFSGELAYELAVPARHGEGAWRAVLEAGAPFGIAPYGTEAMGVMRIEKGHAATAEINGQTTARDLGLSRMLAKKKDYVGRAMKDRPALVDPARPILVGVKPVDGTARLRAGSHFLGIGATASLKADEGHLTSVAFSPTLGHWVGLGFLRHGATRHGERVRAYDPIRGGDTVVEICAPCFVDPAEEKLRA